MCTAMYNVHRYTVIPTKYKHTSTIIIIIMQNHKSFTHLAALSYQSPVGMYSVLKSKENNAIKIYILSNCAQIIGSMFFERTGLFGTLSTDAPSKVFQLPILHFCFTIQGGSKSNGNNHRQMISPIHLQRLEQLKQFLLTYSSGSYQLDDLL